MRKGRPATLLRAAAVAMSLAAGTAAFAAPAAVPAASAAPVRADSDLQTIAEAFITEQGLQGLLLQGVDVVLRTRRERDPEWQAVEREVPGLLEAMLQSTRAAALAELPRLTALLQADATAFFAAKLTPPERARFAAYLRLPYPRRMSHPTVVVRPGETLVQALTRMSREIEASATPLERNQERAFYGSPVGRKCNALAAEFLGRNGARQQELAMAVMKAALAKGEEAGQAYVEAHRKR